MEKSNAAIVIIKNIFCSYTLLLRTNNFLVIYVAIAFFSESDIWNSYVLTHTKDAIAEPLTTLPTKELEAEALKLSKVGT